MSWKWLFGGTQSSQCLHEKGFILQVERKDGERGVMKRGSNQSDKGREGLRTERVTGTQKYGIRNTGDWDDWTESTLNSLDSRGSPVS